MHWWTRYNILRRGRLEKWKAFWFSPFPEDFPTASPSSMVQVTNWAAREWQDDSIFSMISDLCEVAFTYDLAATLWGTAVHILGHPKKWLKKIKQKKIKHVDTLTNHDGGKSRIDSKKASCAVDCTAGFLAISNLPRVTFCARRRKKHEEGNVSTRKLMEISERRPFKITVLRTSGDVYKNIHIIRGIHISRICTIMHIS